MKDVGKILKEYQKASRITIVGRSSGSILFEGKREDVPKSFLTKKVVSSVCYPCPQGREMGLWI